MTHYNDQFLKQLQKGTLELSVLLLLKKGDKYGYELTQLINESKVFNISISSIYPVLNRLLKKKLVEDFWREENGRMRKYYRLTKDGEEVVKENYEQFTDLFQAITFFAKEDDT